MEIFLAHMYKCSRRPGGQVQQQSYDVVAITETCGITHTTGALHFMPMSSSEETGEAEEVEGRPFILGRLFLPWALKLVMMKLNACG